MTIAAGSVEPVMLDAPFRPHTAEYLADPYGNLARLRALGPCVIDPGTGRWLLLGAEHVQAGLSQIVRGQASGPDRHEHFPGNPFAADGPGHTEPRRIVVPTFTNRSVQQFHASAQAIVDEVLDAKSDGDTIDIVEELGFRLPYTLTCEILGVPDVGNRDELRDWTWKCLQLFDPFLSEAELAEYMRAAGALAGHLGEVLVWKRDHMGDDLLSTILRASDDGDLLRPEQVPSYVHTLYLAGMHTTVNQISLTMKAFMDHRDQWDALRAEPSLLENAIEEALRYEPTAQFMRRATEVETDICGVRIPAGTDVICWIASANRDAQRWGPTADTFDIQRADARTHIAFGFGPHVCIGSWLARLELQVVVRSLLERFPNTVMPEQQLDWVSVVLRGPERLELSLGR